MGEEDQAAPAAEEAPLVEAVDEKPAAPTGLDVSVHPGGGIPDVVMIVNEGSEVSPSGDDRTYVGGEEVTVDGPTAIALQSQGVATVKV